MWRGVKGCEGCGGCEGCLLHAGWHDGHRDGHCPGYTFFLLGHNEISLHLSTFKSPFPCVISLGGTAVTSNRTQNLTLLTKPPTCPMTAFCEQQTTGPAAKFTFKNRSWELLQATAVFTGDQWSHFWSYGATLWLSVQK